MEDLIKILTREEYFQKQINGVEPLLDPAFDIEINLRKQLQNELFGEDGSDPANRHVFFKWVWENRPHVCEETGAFLGYTMQAEFMSHILSRGAHVEMWHDPRNINLLVPDAHRKWETGKREKMKIWDKNKPVIARLKADYSQLKNYKTFTEPIEDVLAKAMKEANTPRPGFDFEGMCRQFLYDRCPDLEGEEFDKAMEELSQLAIIYSKNWH
jgi:hypothetical protein